MTDPAFLLVFTAVAILYAAAAAVDTTANTIGSLLPGQRTTGQNVVLLAALYMAWCRWRSRRGETP